MATENGWKSKLKFPTIRIKKVKIQKKRTEVYCVIRRKI